MTQPKTITLTLTEAQVALLENTVDVSAQQLKDEATTDYQRAYNSKLDDLLQILLSAK